VRVRAVNGLIDLCLWNEHPPPFPPDGPKLSCALRVRQPFDASLLELHGYIEAEAEFRNVVALRSNMSFTTLSSASSLPATASSLSPPLGRDCPGSGGIISVRIS
jgi:hypothetical protein